MIKVNCSYKIKDDIEFFLETENKTLTEFSELTKISRMTLDSLFNGAEATDDVLEKIYSCIYKNNYRINIVKEEFLKEKNKEVLFHGSKFGLKDVSIEEARNNCDFGKGFYLGETYAQAASFVFENENSSVYSFKYSLENLKIKRFECNLDWMIAICFYRGTLNDYANNQMVNEVIKEVEDADVIIAPIADNKMFYIMAQFTDGEINCDVALHSLSASRLGYQYIFKTDKALNNLIPLERYYLSKLEKDGIRNSLRDRSYEIDTKLKLAKREFKTGQYIEELFK